MCAGPRRSRLVGMARRSAPDGAGSGAPTTGAAGTRGARPEPGPRPALHTAGVPAPRRGSTLSAFARTGRPALWLAVAAGTVWPLTARAIVASAVVLGGAVCAILAARDPRIPSSDGDGERWRALMLSLCALTGVVACVVEPRGAGYVSVFVVGALVGRLVIDRRIVWGLSTVAGIAVGVALAVTSGSPWALLSGLAIPALASRSLDRARLHRAHTRVLALLAERDALREVELAAAAGHERARIARELHDVLAHTLSGLSLHLQGVRALAATRLGPDDAVIVSVDRAAELARTGLAEAKEAVAALREDSPSSSPRAADLAGLADEHGAALSVSGDLDALSPRIRETVFATTREALTNVGRHAPGAPVSVSVEVGDAVEVRVTDEGATPAEAADAAARGDVGGGKGLVGLRERAGLLGGTLESGPHDGGWRVTLHVPLPVATSVSGRLAP